MTIVVPEWFAVVVTIYFAASIGFELRLVILQNQFRRARRRARPKL